MVRIKIGHKIKESAMSETEIFVSYQFWMGTFLGAVIFFGLLLLAAIISSREQENEREGLEVRLVRLSCIMEVYESLKRLKECGGEEWNKVEDDESVDFEWIPIYCERESQKIGTQLGNIDKKR
jgi:hypothetical protein